MKRMKPVLLLIATGTAMAAMVAMTAVARAEFVEEPPATPDIRFLLQEAIEALGRRDYEAGRTRFQQALALEPDNVAALVNFGSLEYRAGNRKEAITLLRRATRLAPETSSGWIMLGVVAYEDGDDALALASLAQALLLDPSNPQARLYMGVTLGRKGWLDGAEAELRRAISLDETSRDAHFNLAVILLQRQNPALELARHHYDRALELGAEVDSLIEKKLNSAKEKGE